MADTIDRGEPLASAPPEDLGDKGLKHGSVGILSSVVLGVASVAPAYALTATLGPTVSEVGLQMPAIFLAGFIPMLLVAYSYREFNKVAPDAGTSFTWTTKAFGPHIGWLGGWGAVMAMIIVLSNLAGVAVSFLYLMLGEIFGSPGLATLGDNVAVNIITCLAFIVVAMGISYRGMTTTKEVQYALVGIQMAVLALFVILAFVKAINGTSDGRRRLLALLAQPLRRRLLRGLHRRPLALDLYLLGLGRLPDGKRGDDRQRQDAGTGRPLDRAHDREHLPARLDLLPDVRRHRRAGRRTGQPEDRRQRVRRARRTRAWQPRHPLFVAVLISSAASLQATFVAVTRTMLAMGFYKAAPDRMARVHPRYQTPSFATLFAGIGTAIFYTIMRIVSENALIDTIYALGLMICFYYGLTAFGCVWYFRRELGTSFRNFLFKGLFPGLGGIMLALVFLKTAVDTYDPAYGAGGAIFGVGTVFVIGMGILLLGVVLMFVWQLMAPAFFRGETLKRDTPVLEVEE